MGRIVTAAWWSLVFLSLGTVLELWVFSMETNVRARALRMHVLSFHQLLVTAGGYCVWRRVTRVIKMSRSTFSPATFVRTLLLLMIGVSQFSVVLGIILVDREPAMITRISNICLGIGLFLFSSLAAVDLTFFCLGKVFRPRKRRERERRISERFEERWKLLVALVCGVGLSVSGLLGIAQFTVEKLAIPIQGLSHNLNGTTIVQLSDIHLGGYSGRTTLQRIVDRVNDLDPDLVVITGDLVDGAVVYMREIVQPLDGLTTKHGVFFATG